MDANPSASRVLSDGGDQGSRFGEAGTDALDSGGEATETGAPAERSVEATTPSQVDAAALDVDGGGSFDSGVAVDGEARCAARNGLLFCDDFEKTTTGSPLAPWSTSIIGAGTVTIDGTSPAHSGSRSIHVSDGAADYDTLLVLRDASVLPRPSGRFYVRMFIRLAAAMSSGHNTFVVADLAGSPGQQNNLRLGEDDGMLMYTVMGDAHGALSNANYYNDGMLPGVQFTPGTWTCLELLLDSKKPEIDVWVDGKEVPDLHHLDYPLDNYDELRFGFEKYAGPAMDLWFDDIAVGDQPIGCQ